MSLDQSSQYRDEPAFFTIRPNTDSVQSEGVLRIPRLMHLNDADVILCVVFRLFGLGIARICAGVNRYYQPDQSSWSYFTLLPRDFSTGYFWAVTASFSNTI